MDISRAKEIAAGQGWLSLTSPAFRSAVLDRCSLQYAAAGATIFIVGDPPGGLYGLVSGSLGVSIAPGERGPYLAHFVRPGAWLGEGAAVTGQARRVGLTATRACWLLHLPLRGFQDIVAADPSAWRFIALLATLHLNTAVGAADDLMIRDHGLRLVAILLRLGGCRVENVAGDPIDIHANQEELAAMANMARMTAGTILRRLAQKGHVDLSYRHLRILDPDALRAMLRRD